MPSTDKPAATPTHTPGPWTLDLIQKWPFGVRVSAGDKEILNQAAYCSSTAQKSRLDCEMGVGFGGKDTTSIQEAQAHIAEQDANARLIAAAPALLEALKTILSHVEDLDVERMPSSQCTLCYTYRMIGHAAIAAATGEAA